MEKCFNCFKEKEGDVCPHCGYDPASDAEKYPFALPHGSILAGQYVTGRVLGQGGFGITYVAEDVRVKERVAIKEYFPDILVTRTQKHNVTAYSGQKEETFSYGLQCFLSEAQTLAALVDVPNVVKIHSYFEENGTAYFVMDYLDGVSLETYVKEHGGRLTWEDTCRLLMPIVDALSVVHSKGIIHRDVTPDNIFITKDGSAKLLDFGAARYSLGDRSQSLDVVLKHGYAPREQYTRRGRQGAYTDIYSLGATFYYCLTGHVPTESIDRMEGEALIPPSNYGVAIPTATEKALEKALAVQASDRYQSMGQFKEGLLEKEPVPDPIPPKPLTPSESQTPPEPPVQSSKKKLRYVAAILVVLLLVGGVGMLMSGPSDKDSSDLDNQEIASAETVEASSEVNTETEADQESGNTVAEDEPILDIEDLDGMSENTDQSWENNILMADVCSEGSEEASEYSAFKMDLTRTEVTSITFLDTLGDAPEDAEDLSEAQDGSVLGWKVKDSKYGAYDLYIAGEGGVAAPANCMGMFNGYDNVTYIEFNGAFHTEYAENMNYMFKRCGSLTYLDLSGFDTSGVESMEGMFHLCSSLKEAVVSSFDTSHVTCMKDMFSECESLTKVDVSGFKTSNVTDMSFMFSHCSSLLKLDVSGFDTGNVTTMLAMFQSCTSLNKVDVSGFNTPNVTDMSYMFTNCSSLSSLDVSGFDTSKVKDISRMFNGCSSLSSLDVSDFVTSNVSDMSYMFSYCSSLERLDLSSFDTSNVTNMSYMFLNCSSLGRLDLSSFDTSNVTNMSYMFANCSSLSSLDVSGFDTGNVTSMRTMFQYCTGLKKLDLSNFDTSNVTDMSYMFSNCSSLESLDLSSFDTSNVTNMSRMFPSCSSLESLDLSSFDTSNVTNMSVMFQNCTSLNELDVSNFDTANVTDMSYMFVNCSAVSVDDISEWDVSSVTIYDYFMGGSGWESLFG